VAFKHPIQAERACVFPQVRRVDGLQVSIVAEDMFTANAFFRTISALSSAE